MIIFFYGCTNLEKVVFLDKTLSTFGAHIFDNVPLTCEIYVPDESVSAYVTALSAYSLPIRALSTLPEKISIICLKEQHKSALKKLVLHRDLIIEQANLKGANIPLNSDYPAIIAGIESITTGLNPTEVETLLDDILGEVIVGDYTAKGQAILDKIADVLSSIESKGVVVPVDAELTDCPALIDSIQTGGGTDGHKVVTYDYDGITILKTEYVQDGQDGTPPNDPNHAYLVLSGYHGSYVNVTEDRDIYALYTTIDDVTVLFFRLPKSVNSITLNVTSYHVDGFTYAFNGDTAVTVAGSGNKQINRTLTAGVTHTLVLGKVSANSSIKLGRPASYQNCIPLGQLAINTLIKVYFGNNCGIESYCFKQFTLA